MGAGSFPGVKRLGRSVDHPLPFSVEVKEKLELYLYSIFVVCYRVRFSNYTTHSFRIFYIFLSRIAAIFRELHSLRTHAACILHVSSSTAAL
jgi:hypothetical protein